MNRAGRAKALPLAASLAVMAICAALGACGSSHSPVEDIQRVRLQLVADAVEIEAYKVLIEAFEQTHPRIKIELQSLGRQREHVTKLAISFAGRKPPDLFLINYRRYGQFLGKRLLEPLGPLLEANGHFRSGDFFAPALEAFQENGAQLCIPQNISTQVVYYNRALFQQYGIREPRANWTWTEFHDAARDLTRDTDGDQQKDLFGFDFDPDLVHMAPFIWQAGGQVVDDLDAPTRLLLRDYRSVSGLMFPKRLRTEVGVMPPLAQRRAVGPEQRFIKGGLGMVIQSRRFATSLRAVKNLDWDVAPLPRQKAAATLLHADAYCLSASSRAREAAARFVGFAVSAEGQSQLARTGRIVPSRISVAQSPAFLDPEQPPSRAQVFLDNIDIVRRLPVTPYWYELETRSKPIIEEWMFESAAAAKAESKLGFRDGNRLVFLLDQAVGHLMSSSP